jgi:mRNA interferase RelE/StbE
MAGYKLYFKKPVWRDFKTILASDLKRILDRIASLAENPRPAGCEKLTGREKYRLRQGRYRILYTIQDEDLTIWVIKVGHRKGIYC